MNRPSAIKVKLPFDVIPNILAILEFDVATLSSCSLVCHLWLHPSRKLLFRHIKFPLYITEGDDAAPSDAAIDLWKNITRRVTCMPSHLAAYAKALLVYQPPLPPDYIPHYPLLPPILMIIRTLLESLPCVDTMFSDGVALTEGDPHSTPGRRRKLQILVLKRVLTGQNIADLFHMFSDIKYLSMESCSTFAWEVQHPQHAIVWDSIGIRIKTHVQCINLTNVPSLESVLSTIIHIIDIPELQTFHCSFHGDAHEFKAGAESVALFLQRSDLALTTVVMDFNALKPNNTYWIRLPELFTVMHDKNEACKLHLEICLGDRIRTIKDGTSKICHLPPCTTHLIFYVAIETANSSTENWKSREPWQIWNQTLKSFNNLCKVLIGLDVVYLNKFEEDPAHKAQILVVVKKAIENELAGFKAKGILQICKV